MRKDQTSRIPYNLKFSFCTCKTPASISAITVTTLFGVEDAYVSEGSVNVEVFGEFVKTESAANLTTGPRPLKVMTLSFDLVGYRNESNSWEKI